MALTDKQIKNAKPTDKKQTLSDGGGLSLVVTPQGGKYWQYNFRFNGKQKTLRLGIYPDVPLTKARERHLQARMQLADGIDPAAAKQEEKQAEKAAFANTFEKSPPNGTPTNCQAGHPPMPPKFGAASRWIFCRHWVKSRYTPSQSSRCRQ
ncbi:hypothetical protein J2T38_000195 [Neisseria perflava]|nr:hypothetical protein [Neisseria perflava]